MENSDVSLSGLGGEYQKQNQQNGLSKYGWEYLLVYHPLSLLINGYRHAKEEGTSANHLPNEFSKLELQILWLEYQDRS